MPENELDPITEAIGKIENVMRDWTEVDADEQEYLDRLWSFGEGYFDMSNFDEHFGSGETGVVGA